MEPLVSVVVPTFNRRTSLKRLLEALAEQTYQHSRFEVVVVDDGSTDGSVELARSLALPYALRVLEQPHNGPAAARNLGVERALGSLILFLDDDVVPLPDLITTHVATHQANPDSVVVGPMSPPNDWPRPVWVRWEEDKLEVQYRALLAGEYPCTPRQFYTANASLVRAQFLDVGGFDTRFQRAEDVELAFRLGSRGVRFLFSPQANVWHYASRSFEAWCRTPYLYGRYDVIMHREKGHPTLPCTAFEFRGRHPVNQLAARACVGHPLLVQGAVGVLAQFMRAADLLGRPQAAKAALSGIFNLLYWQGACEELGGPEFIWRSVALGAPVPL